MTDRAAPRSLLDDETLHASSVVANYAMNRERQLTGVNSYTREHGFDPLDLLTAAVAERRGAGWLDLCCGTGRALIQVAEQLRRAGLLEQICLVGVDLVDAFDSSPSPPGPTLLATPVTAWTPTTRFDLITCVHGLHYLGDKLAVIARAARWLAPTGRLVADLDLASIRLVDGRPAGRRLSAQLRAAGIQYDTRRHRITCTGPRELRLPYTYLGADDHAGPKVVILTAGDRNPGMQSRTPPRLAPVIPLTRPPRHGPTSALCRARSVLGDAYHSPSSHRW